MEIPGCFYLCFVNPKSNHINDCRVFFRNKLLPSFSENESNQIIWQLLEGLLGIRKIDVLSGREILLSESEIVRISQALKELMKNKPIQYVIGEVQFCDLPIAVSQEVLIPRPETEEMVQMIIEEHRGRRNLNVLDIGTGSGCIALALKAYLPQSSLTAIDISKGALNIAKSNAQRNNLDISFMQSDILHMENIPGNPVFDILVSNPPYVTLSEKKSMESKVKDFEPAQALFVTDEDPLIFYKAILRMAEKYLVGGGQVYCEINQAYGKELLELLSHYPAFSAKVLNDFKNNSRFLKILKK